MQDERWMNVKGYEGSYQVDINGNVKSLPRSGKLHHGGMFVVKETMKKLWFNEHGERVVQLSKHSQRTIHKVRDLVRDAFGSTRQYESPC